MFTNGSRCHWFINRSSRGRGSEISDDPNYIPNRFGNPPTSGLLSSTMNLFSCSLSFTGSLQGSTTDIVSSLRDSKAMSIPISTVGSMLDDISDALGKFGMGSESSRKSVEQIGDVIGDRSIRRSGIWNRTQIRQRRIGILNGGGSAVTSRFGSGTTRDDCAS